MRGLQGFITESLWVALASFCKVDNLLSNRLTGRVGGPAGALEHHKRHFVCEAHDAEYFGVKPLAIEVESDRYMHLPVQAGALLNSQSPTPG